MILSKKAEPNSACINGYEVSLLLISIFVFFSISLHASDITLTEQSDESDIIKKIDEAGEVEWEDLLIQAFQLNKMKVLAHLLEQVNKFADGKLYLNPVGIRPYGDFLTEIIDDYYQSKEKIKSENFLKKCDAVFAIANEKKVKLNITPNTLKHVINNDLDKPYKYVDCGDLFNYFLKKGDELHPIDEQKPYWLNGATIQYKSIRYITFLTLFFDQERDTQLVNMVVEKMHDDKNQGIDIFEKNRGNAPITALAAACDQNTSSQNSALPLLNQLTSLYQKEPKKVISYINSRSLGEKSALAKALKPFKKNDDVKNPRLEVIAKLLSFKEIRVDDNDFSSVEKYASNHYNHKLVLGLLKGAKNKLVSSKEFEALKKKDDDHQQEIEKIKKLNIELKNEVENFTKINRDLQSKIDELEKEKKALEQTLQPFQKGGNLDQMTTEWQEEKAALEQKLNEANQTITDEKVNLTATQSSLASAKRWVWVLSIISVGMIIVCIYGYKQVKQKAAQTVY